jgi:hypothetical protein
MFVFIIYLGTLVQIVHLLSSHSVAIWFWRKMTGREKEKMKKVLLFAWSTNVIFASGGGGGLGLRQESRRRRTTLNRHISTHEAG